MESTSSFLDNIADRYASALYDLASEKKCIDKISSDLKIVKEHLNENKDFNLLINSPLISSQEKLRVLNKITDDYSSNIYTKNLFKILAKNKRLNKISPIISRYNAINAKKRGNVIADIISAEELSEKQKMGIDKKLKSILGEKLFLNFKIDTKLLGGLIVKIGSKMVDAYLISKINKLKISMEEA